MGLIGGLLGFGRAAGQVGAAVGDVAEVFSVNKTREMELDQAARMAALSQLGAEFARPRQSLFDALIDGINRLPRPVMATGTIGLFVYAMIDPGGFGARMQGLVLVPDPLWWLLGAVVSFYFGARELHYMRRKAPDPAEVAGVVARMQALDPPEASPDASQNAALQDWRRRQA